MAGFFFYAIYNRGNFIVRLLPCYGVLSASMVPWWSVMILWVTTRPNPTDSTILPEALIIAWVRKMIDMIWI
jgi:hypothetical protein